MVINGKRDDALIVGTGRTAEIVFEYLKCSSFDVIGFAENNPCSATFRDLPVYDLDRIDDEIDRSVLLFTAIGVNKLNTVRQRVYESLKERGWSFLTFVHPRATVAETARIGENCFVMEENVIQDFVEIGSNNILWSGNHIGHHTKIGDHNFISSHVVVSGNCDIGNNNFFGVNSCTGDDVKVGDFNWFSPLTSTIKDIQDENLLIMPKPVFYKSSSKQFFGVE